MHRTARLLQAADQVRKRLWASLPWGVRLASFWERFAVTTKEAFGRTIYAEFIKRGIEGMPEVNGKAPDPQRLPKDYGAKFADRAYRIVMSKVRNPALVDEILSNFIVYFISKGSALLDPSKGLKSAESLVYTALGNRVINHYKSKGRKKETPIPVSDDGESGEKEVDFPSPSELDTTDVKRLLHHLQPKLERIHPDAPLYVQLAFLEGYKDRDIIGDPAHGKPSMLPHPVTSTGIPLNIGNWSNKYKEPIREILQEGFEQFL